MKLSDAILKGCEIIPHQAFGAFFADESGATCTSDEAYAACAYGAAKAGNPDRAYSDKALNGVPCPQCGEKVKTSMVVHLNDDHRWSRERIAEWLKEQGL